MKLALDSDSDGDMDLMICASESVTPLILLRNDGDNGVLPGGLVGKTWSKQAMDINYSIHAITSGGLEGKDDEDDWTGGGNENSGPLLNGTLGSMDQINIIPPESPSCAADFNEDNVVDISDLLSLIAAWGTCESCPEDMNIDGAVDVSDLLSLIAAWGDC